MLTTLCALSVLAMTTDGPDWLPATLPSVDAWLAPLAIVAPEIVDAIFGDSLRYFLAGYD